MRSARAPIPTTLPDPVVSDRTEAHPRQFGLLHSFFAFLCLQSFLLALNRIQFLPAPCVVAFGVPLFQLSFFLCKPRELLRFLLGLQFILL